MPIYEYQCKKHGVFEVQKHIVDLEPSEPCPTCDKVSGRILSLPQISFRSRADRRAMDRNEKSRFEPRVVNTRDMEPPKKKARDKGRPRGPQLQAAHGRPWAIGH